MSDEHYMRQAIDKAKEGIQKGQTPFAACIVKDNNVISCEHNIVWQSCDITAHAEVNAIRIACKNLNCIDLSDCILYSTCEPCPMCFSAIHWGRIGKIVYGARIEDAEQYGFRELCISNKKMKQLGNTSIEIVGDVLREGNIELFKLWSQQENKKAY